MNYRHAFHAGGFADVIKHIVLVRILTYLQNKQAPFRVIDTHAGAGVYDLTSDEALRGGESLTGVARVMQARFSEITLPLVAPYLDIVRAFNPQRELKAYPGSPLIARALLRPQQRPRDQRRSGIGLELALRVEGPDDVEIGRDQRQSDFRKSRLHHPGDAGEPFAAAERFIAGEIVDPRAGMGVDDAKRSLLVLQIGENAHQHDVLDDVGKAAGVEGVTVVHAASSTPREPIEQSGAESRVPDAVQRPSRCSAEPGPTCLQAVMWA